MAESLSILQSSYSSCFIDAHSHLTDEVFDKIGVKAALVVSENEAQFNKVISLADRFPEFVLPCLGVHPVQQDADQARSVNLKDIENVAAILERHHERLGAVGEIGLDFTPRFCKADDDKTTQKLVFTQQVQLAQKYDLPINVHSRSAGRPTIALLKELGASRVLMHAFDGKPSVALDGVRAGFYFSIPPSIVRSQQKDKLVSQLPLENIILETDSPALGPVKEERNVPANVTISCDYIATVKKIDPKEVRLITTQNAIKLFPKLVKFFAK
ncbi:putative deoxyribonuclease TATDN3 isoform X2 [Gigantopelta aegis]|uniref:putative deoxyribonuclease TATDN3 isoform X2 n=1 Tax=Gigantopelta aegis TaxID=1735272 RepID=UPI001B88B574|nr:putative deoxyribonuclease TATDN3 isoform X2 [Gigantopelta aegis]